MVAERSKRSRRTSREPGGGCRGCLAVPLPRMPQTAATMIQRWRVTATGEAKPRVAAVARSVRAASMAFHGGVGVRVPVLLGVRLKKVLALPNIQFSGRFEAGAPKAYCTVQYGSQYGTVPVCGFTPIASSQRQYLTTTTFPSPPCTQDTDVPRTPPGVVCSRTDPVACSRKWDGWTAIFPQTRTHHDAMRVRAPTSHSPVPDATLRSQCPDRLRRAAPPCGTSLSEGGRGRLGSSPPGGAASPCALPGRQETRRTRHSSVPVFDCVLHRRFQG